MRYLFFLLLITQTWPCFSQKIVQAKTLKEALKKGERQNKLVFVQFESATCMQCNEVADLGINENNVKSALQKDFIFLKIPTNHPDREQIGQVYHISKGFGILFLNSKGSLVHRWSQSSTRDGEYEKQMTLALSKKQNGAIGDDLTKAYQQGNRNTDFLESYIQHLQMLNLPTDSIVEEYVSLLPADSFQSIRTLVFISKMAPALTSKADQALRKNPALFNQAWYTIDLPLRVNINNAILNKTMRQAIEEKNERKALRAAAFIKGVNSNPDAGEKNYQRSMLRYYEATGDTTTYFRKAVAFYTGHFMNISPDSVKRLDSVNQQKMMAQSPMIDTIINGKPAKIKQVAFAPGTQRYTGELNDAAWKMYNMTSNPNLLMMATKWVEKGLEFYESPEALHTYAHLLYKQGKVTEAVEKLDRTIAIRKERGYPVKEYETLLQKMKKGAALD